MAGLFPDRKVDCSYLRFHSSSFCALYIRYMGPVHLISRHQTRRLVRSLAHNGPGDPDSICVCGDVYGGMRKYPVLPTCDL